MWRWHNSSDLIDEHEIAFRHRFPSFVSLIVRRWRRCCYAIRSSCDCIPPTMMKIINRNSMPNEVKSSTRINSLSTHFCIVKLMETSLIQFHFDGIIFRVPILKLFFCENFQFAHRYSAIHANMIFSLFAQMTQNKKTFQFFSFLFRSLKSFRFAS